MTGEINDTFEHSLIHSHFARILLMHGKITGVRAGECRFDALTVSIHLSGFITF